jgi:hypothetical protein
MEEKINMLINKLYDNREEIKRLETKNKRYRERLKHYMNDININNMRSGDFKIKLRTTNASRINKRDIPIDLWNQYSTTSTTQSIHIDKIY